MGETALDLESHNLSCLRSWATLGMLTFTDPLFPHPQNEMWGSLCCINRRGWFRASSALERAVLDVPSGVMERRGGSVGSRDSGSEVWGCL